MLRPPGSPLDTLRQGVLLRVVVSPGKSKNLRDTGTGIAARRYKSLGLRARSTKAGLGLLWYHPMRPVTQTKFGREGNCLMACVASILERPLESLPDFVCVDEDNWWTDFQKLMIGLGYKPRVRYDESNPPKGYSIRSGMAARGLCHACVALDGEVVWDPHPDHTGLLDFEDFIILEPIGSLT